jgi:hypothetical protein
MLLHENWCKMDELVLLTHKFSKRGYVGSYRIERTQSTFLDQKLMFWGVSNRLVTTRKSVQNGLNSVINAQVC